VSPPSAAPDLEPLVACLTARALDDEPWRIASEEVRGLLGMEPVAFWRALHGVRDRIGFADAIDGWTSDTVGDLVTFLEAAGAAGAEERLAAAGLFIPWAVGVELLEQLIERAQRLAAAHDLRTDELEAMLRHAGTVKGAIGIYLDEHVDTDALIEGCAESFRALRGLPAVAAVTAAGWLRAMRTRHLLEKPSLVAGLVERLRLAAAVLGWTDPDDRARRAGAAREAMPPETRRRAWALGVMGFSRGGYTAEDLRARYRALMMRHHPDADPGGLERCKDVNVAYALLIAEAPAR
jgi:hypothetical protein